jgi:integrase
MTKKANNREFAKNSGSHLKLVASVTNDAVEKASVPRPRTPLKTDLLTDYWEDSIRHWVTWMVVSGSPITTQRLRSDHLYTFARRSKTRHPAEVTLEILVRVCSAGNWSREYRRSVRYSLISFFAWALDNEKVSHNPALLMPKVPSATPNPNPVPDEVWEQILLAAPPRERMMIRLAGLVGLRRAEVAQVRREDVIRDHRGWMLLVNGKGGKQRVVPIHDKLAQSLRDFVPAGYLFPGSDNGHLTPRTVGMMVSAVMPDGWSMHKLRHRYATRGLDRTGNLLLVRDALGHASVATTQIYTKIVTEQMRTIADAAADDDS